ncbi:hypothetical protein JR316_0002943 [Psilocybe cubensis]|uniref:Uncharacterized protein n=2 Tax=Psilocybe cubensis TaxID=181762 RepID=A0ACB8H651_PSICU|nr:hypothetical protein JR316_0002943 [Psilocybe cubensis]KAH9483475.1 hypothetical protein JR316_0002943 [Psilocybe cubensis]
MHLCLVNNDPTSTLLITPDGEPLFSIETPLLHSPEIELEKVMAAPARRQKSPITQIKRIERYQRSAGHVETQIGVVEYCGKGNGTKLQLCMENHALAITARTMLGIEGAGDFGEQTDEEDENFWEFTGPDSKQYRWQIFVHSPVLLLADNSFTPLARYRRAKLGIVSRSRRAFLEILPAGINLIDLIVVTFVGFMKQRVMVEGGAAPHVQDTDANLTSSTPNLQADKQSMSSHERTSCPPQRSSTIP